MQFAKTQKELNSKKHQEMLRAMYGIKKERRKRLGWDLIRTKNEERALFFVFGMVVYELIIRLYFNYVN